MTDTVTVASRAPMAIQIQEPLPDKYRDRPGDAPMLRTETINGANHTSARGGVGFTHRVNAKVFDLWHKAQKASNSVLAGLVSVVDPEEANKPLAVEYGFESGLKRLAENGENTKVAEQGSIITHEGPIASEELAARSETPNDDSPRGDMTQAAQEQEPATKLIALHPDEVHESEPEPKLSHKPLLPNAEHEA